ncbi:tyrosine-protein phosphatase [Sporosarcina sp. YIM B06819]|uniref:tyrosine-protein phosphatase n=1 Tax=Sporosarcina sp. YIM B06819 TaxID=3081769 RepID=UPI00298CD1B3|nr:CpsB/CapC family capsule biosynthesis tyrosine phosphatase [Sporosarcina sp. YIM B06819]
MKAIVVDIHNHILPGIDDGPQTEAEAIELAKNASANGITHIIATPHHRNGIYNNNALNIQYLVNKLNHQLTSQGVPITILEGMEIRLYENLLNELTDSLVSLAGSKKYMLIELPKNHIPHYTATIFFEMQLRGYIPIIAHAERNTVIRSDPSQLFEFVNRGALVQVNASSITGANGRALRKFALKLCKDHLVHFIASDAHHLTKRPFLLSFAYAYLQRKLSPDYVDYVKTNAQHVLNGTEFHILPPIQPK